MIIRSEVVVTGIQLFSFLMVFESSIID